MPNIAATIKLYVMIKHITIKSYTHSMSLILAGSLAFSANSLAQESKAKVKNQVQPKKELSTYKKVDNWQKGGLFEGFSPNQEIKEKRSQNSKSFRNEDGSITAQIGRSIHYKDAGGNWQEIDLSVRQGINKPGYLYGNVTNNIKSFFSENPKQQGVLMDLGAGNEFGWWKNPSLRFTNNGQTIATHLPNAVKGQIQGTKIVYPNLYNGISEEFVVLNEGLENNTIIHQLTPEISALGVGSILEFSQFIPLESGWQILANGQAQTSNFEAGRFSISIPGMENKVHFGKIVVFDNTIDKKQAMFLVHSPIEKLSASQKQQLNENIYTISYKVRFVNGGIEVVSQLPASWLQANSRSFPVTVDPTVTITPVDIDSDVNGPMTHWYGYQRHADLYLQSEIGAYGSITQIEYNSTSDGQAGSRPTKIFMRTSADATLTDGDAWNSNTYTNGATLCLDANTDQGDTQGWKALPLTTPFTYSQDNLVIMVYDAWGGSGSSKQYSMSYTVEGRQVNSREDGTDPGDGATMEIEDYLPEIRITYNPLSACSGTPVAGTATASATDICLGSTLNLNLASPPIDGGITYQWQSSPDGTAWSNLGSSQSSPFYSVTGQTAATQYRVIVTCTNSSESDTSTAVSVGIASPTNCYCTPTPSDCSDGDVIENFTFAGINNNSSCSSTNGYQNYVGTVAPASVLTELAYPVSVTVGNGGIEAVAVWIDYNQDGTFEMSEYTYIGHEEGGVITSSITIPPTALAGTTRMRVRCFYADDTDLGNTYTSEADPACGPIYIEYGETEDYAVTIAISTPCAGSPSAGTIASSATTVCPNVAFSLNVTGNSQSAGLVYQWQSSEDGTTWTNLGTTTTQTISSITATTEYRLIVTCTASTLSDTSNVISVTQTPANGCYCIPVLDCTDGDLMTNVTFVSINNNSACGTDGYSDYRSSIPAAEIALDSTYNISVTVGDGFGYESVSVWIDYNQNGVFDTDEFTYIATGSDEAVTGTITIPNTALYGTTTMRVRVAAVDTAYVSDDLACDEDQVYGETEDYLVYIAPPVDSIVVNTLGNVAPLIPSPTGTLQLEATVYPTSTDQSVTWSIIPVTGTATISASGLVTAQSLGTVWGKAVSVADVTKADSILINITTGIDSVVVKTLGNVPATITTPSGTLALQPTVYPLTASQTVTWSIIPVTGAANISGLGIVMAVANGTVWAKAVSTVDATKSDSILVTITGQGMSIDESTTFDLNLYPNPTSDVVMLSSGKAHGALRLQVVDIAGKVLISRALQPNELNSGVTVDMVSFASGTYIIKVQGEKLNINKRIVRK